MHLRVNKSFMISFAESHTYIDIYLGMLGNIEQPKRGKFCLYYSRINFSSNIRLRKIYVTY